MKRVDPAYLAQLDILRGFAILLMVINHAGFAVLDPRLQREPIVATLIFAGSFAPVIFFFTTGFGIGIARTNVALQDFRSSVLKAILLIVADQFFFWSHGTLYGLDFLSFIAISTVLVTAVAAYSRPVRLSAVMIIIFVGLRFVLGPWLRQRASLTSVGDWIIGIKAVEGVSYPLSPWIIYPLVGFIIARLYRSSAGSLMTFLWPWPGIAALAAILIAFALSFTNAEFFRWGSVSFAYFDLSIGVVFLALIGIWQLHLWLPHTAQLIALRGIASLAVVPIHYALIEALLAQGISPPSLGSAAVMFACLIVLTIALANTFAGWIRLLMSMVPDIIVGATLTGVVLLCAILIWLPAPHAFLISTYVAIGQLAIAGLMAALRRPRNLMIAKRSVQIDT